MVFVTVGTHEQPFDRLMYEVEELVTEGKLEDVVVQSGYCTVEPKGCRCEQFFPYEEMCQLYQKADVVICHGGPSTFLEAMSYGKTPVVVPRRAKYGEHVNDHQAEFCAAFERRQGGIVVVDDASLLGDCVKAARKRAASKRSTHAADFCRGLEMRINEMVEHNQ